MADDGGFKIDNAFLGVTQSLSGRAWRQRQIGGLPAAKVPDLQVPDVHGSGPRCREGTAPLQGPAASR